MRGDCVGSPVKHNVELIGYSRIAHLMPTQEPSLERCSTPLTRYAMATRPAFLSITVVGVLIGFASAHAGGLTIEPIKALLTLLFALVAHAGANVINDYYDALNGSDAANQQRLYPFTGGSRFIQNGVLSLTATRRLGYSLLALVIPAGLWLTAVSSNGLLLIGLAGLALAWAYSAPPLQLMTRGLGEFAIAGGWLLIVIGADYVQRGAFAAQPLIAGLPFALLVVAILFLNQFPDANADASAGKRTLVVRLGVEKACWGLPGLCVLAYLWLIVAICLHQLPLWSAISILPAFISFSACKHLLHNANQPAQLVKPIQQTILAANLHGLLLALTLGFLG